MVLDGSYFQYMPDKDLVLELTGNQNLRNKFDLVDSNLSMLGFTASIKNTIFMVLSAILNLGNIRFGTTNNDGCAIEIESRNYLANAAALLNVNELELEDALTCHTRFIGNQQIK